MDQTKIAEACGPDEQLENYLTEVARRLETSIGSKLSERDCFALMDILVSHTIRYRDGFEMNSSTDPSKMIGFSLAAAVAAAMHGTEKSWMWFKTHNAGANKDEVYVRALEKLKARILSGPEVVEPRLKGTGDETA
jgi:hypothetical protein